MRSHGHSFFFLPISLNCFKLRNQIVTFTYEHWINESDLCVGSSSYTQKPTTVDYRVVSWSNQASCISFFVCFETATAKKHPPCLKYEQQETSTERISWSVTLQSRHSLHGLWSDQNSSKTFELIETSQLNLPFCLTHNCAKACSQNDASILLMEKKKEKRRNKGYAKHKARLLWFTFGHKFCWLGSGND